MRQRGGRRTNGVKLGKGLKDRWRRMKQQAETTADDVEGWMCHAIEWPSRAVLTKRKTLGKRLTSTLTVGSPSRNKLT